MVLIEIDAMLLIPIVVTLSTGRLQAETRPGDAVLELC